MARISGQGNIQAALDNLPAHIVSRFKVYDKAGGQSEQQSWKNNENVYQWSAFCFLSIMPERISKNL